MSRLTAEGLSMTDAILQPEALERPFMGPRPGIRAMQGGVLLGLLALVFLVSLSLGSVSIPLRQIPLILFRATAERATWVDIIWLFRLPRTITALLAGGALAVAGLQMQTLFRNPLADPYVLGISSGASLGVALVVLGLAGTHVGKDLLDGLGFGGQLGIVAAASLGAAAVMLLVLGAARRVRTIALLILGLMVGYAVNGLVSILLHFSVAERVQVYVAWTFGSFGGVTWSDMKVFAPALLLALALGGALVKPLNTLLLGEDYARSMGLNVDRARTWIVISASVLTGVVTAFCGPIGFLGVAVPHLCRHIFKISDHRALLPAVILTGGIVAMIAQIIAQVPGSQLVLPLNAITALIGAPVVVWAILRRGTLAGAMQA
jgi:iron complex transport system permease protein